MKKPMSLLVCTLSMYLSQAQVGIGTTSPTTTLDVRGSIAANTRSFTTSQSVLSTDYALLFTGTSDATITLPDATAFGGRIIHLKNTKTGTVPEVTITTTSSQTIDGNLTYLLDDPGESVNVVSDGANWLIMGQSLPAGSGSSWTQGGNAVSSVTNLGTTTAYALPFITNGTERMRITADGNVGIGTSTFSAAGSTEKLNISSTGTNTVIYAKGDVNDFFQLNVQNLNNSNFASTDIVATANNGSNSTVYIDMGINSQGYTSGSSSILNGSNTAYLFATGSNFYIGNGAQNRDLIFFTNTGATGADGSERMRVTSGGTIGIGTGSSANTTYKLHVNGTVLATQYYTTSDRRLKKDITPLRYGLKEVMSLQPVSYRFIEDKDNKIVLGLIAQEVQEIVPDVVSKDKEGDMLRMNYTELVPVLINAIKDQQKQIDDLKKKVEALEKK